MFDCFDLIKLPLWIYLRASNINDFENGISKDAAIITDIAAALDFSQDVFSLSLQQLILRETCFQTASRF